MPNTSRQPQIRLLLEGIRCHKQLWLPAMPDRILRDELLESQRWLELPDNTCRLAFVCLIPKGDALGNMEGSAAALWRLWRDPLALREREAVGPIKAALAVADLIREYLSTDGRELIHIPRYRQRLRHLGRLWPLSPWTTNEEKQRIGKNTTGEGQVRVRQPPAEVKRSEVEVEVEVEVEEKRSKPNAVPNPQHPKAASVPNNVSEKKSTTNNKAERWDASDEGIEGKARALGIAPHPGESHFILKQRCWSALNILSRNAPASQAAQPIGNVMLQAIAHLKPPAE